MINKEIQYCYNYYKGRRNAEFICLLIAAFLILACGYLIYAFSIDPASLPFLKDYIPEDRSQSLLIYGTIAFLVALLMFIFRIKDYVIKMINFRKSLQMYRHYDESPDEEKNRLRVQCTEVKNKIMEI